MAHAKVRDGDQKPSGEVRLNSTGTNRRRSACAVYGSAFRNQTPTSYYSSYVKVKDAEQVPPQEESPLIGVDPVDVQGSDFNLRVQRKGSNPFEKRESENVDTGTANR